MMTPKNGLVLNPRQMVGFNCERSFLIVAASASWRARNASTSSPTLKTLVAVRGTGSRNLIAVSRSTAASAFAFA
jgi:hypothetical protein